MHFRHYHGSVLLPCTDSSDVKAEVNSLTIETKQCLVHQEQVKLLLLVQ